jgi:hypothetical protein
MLLLLRLHQRRKRTFCKAPAHHPSTPANGGFTGYIKMRYRSIGFSRR